MQATAALKNQPATCVDDIPQPIVNLNRWTLVVGLLAGLALQQPLFTTALFLMLLSAVAFGQRGSLIFQVGKRVLMHGNATGPGLDKRLMRFNNSIATILLGLAQPAFLLGLPIVGWALSLMVVVAAGIAIAGFCVGCFLYHQFRLNRYRLLSKL